MNDPAAKHFLFREARGPPSSGDHLLRVRLRIMSGPEVLVTSRWLSVMITLIIVMLTLVIFTSVRGGNKDNIYNFHNSEKVAKKTVY